MREVSFQDNRADWSRFALASWAAMIVGCGDGHPLSRGDTAAEVPAPSALEPLSVGVSLSLHSAPVVLAREYGYFKRAGLQVTLRSYPSGTPAYYDMLDGQLDVASAPEHIAAFGGLEKEDFRVFGVTGRSQTTELVARRDHHIASVPELRGRRIGVKLESSSPYWLSRLLLYRGLSLEDVTLVDGSPADLVSGLASGELDALVSWLPYADRARRALGENAFSMPAQVGQDIYWLLFARTDWVRSHGVQIRRFLDAISQAIEAQKAAPERAREILTRFHGSSSSYVDFESSMHHFALELPQSLLIAMEQEARWKLRLEHSSAEIPNYLDLIYADGVAAVKPEAVTLIY